MTIESVLKIVIILILTGSFWMVKYKKREYTGPFVLAYCILALLSGVISWKVTNILPVPTENVTITAMQQKNEKSKGDEIYLTKIFANGKEVKLRTSTEDKWFWQKDWYVWRNDSDLKRPDILSNALVLDIPIGNNRYIEFYANQYKGILQVEYEEDRQTIDCYSEADEIRKVYISDTGKSKILIYYVILLAFFAVIFFFLFWTSNFLLTSSKREQLLKNMMNLWDLIIIIVLSITEFWILSHIYPSTEHFYFDHVVTLGAALSEKFKDVWNFLMLHPPVPPMPLFLEYLYFKIVPYGYNWIFLLPSICISLSIYLIGRFVSKYSTKMMGITAAILAMGSATFVEYGKDIRHYSFSILMMILIISSYVKYREIPNKKTIAIFSIVMSISAYCNYHLIIVLLGVFLFDMILHLKYFHFRLLIPYFIAGIIFSPWIIIITFKLMQAINDLGKSSTWHSSLSFEFLKDVIYYINGQNTILLLVFVISLVTVVYWILGKTALSSKNFIFSFSTYLISFFTIFVILWAILNPKNTLLNYRYFSIIISLVPIVQCAMFNELINHISIKNTVIEFIFPLIIFITCIPFSMFLIIGNQNINPYGWLFCPSKVVSNKEAYYQTSCIYTYIDISRHGTYIKEKRNAIEYMLRKDGVQYPINYDVLTYKNINSITNYDKIYIIDLPVEQKENIEQYGFTMEFRQGKLTIFSTRKIED